MNVLKYWKKLEDDLYIISADGLEDFRAVLGSKTSRAADLNLKSEMDLAGVESFLKLNLAGYGHASIGEMSFPSVHHRGFGWVGAWLIEDDPLFIGQEVSSRAVDLENLPDGENSCYDAPEFLKEEHNIFMNIFRDLKAKNQETKGYKFDNIRWALPGTIRSGVTLMMNSRTGLRHLERLESLPFMDKCVKKFKHGFKDCSPYVYEALAKNSREPQHRWINVDTIKIDSQKLSLDSAVVIEAASNLKETECYKNFKQVNPRAAKNYLDPVFKSLGLFKITIFTSVAAARDWHRHRTLMPWDLKFVIDKHSNQPFFVNWFELGEHEDRANSALKSGYEKCINKINEKNNKMQLFYSLPFGAAVAITAYATLPELLYMLELRAYASGGNFEYIAQAKLGLKLLKEILGEEFSNYNSINL